MSIAASNTELCCLVLDIGKTNVKFHLLSKDGSPIAKKVQANEVQASGEYPHFDVQSVFDALLEQIQDWSQKYSISRISVTTHGATAALVDRSRWDLNDDGLVLPVLDYEYEGVDAIEKQYAQARPEFSDTFSPPLPLGLNLGRQIYWQQCNFPERFAQATDILMYPQYWAWRLSGELCSEVSSLGCHTDLWAPDRNQFSNLVEGQGWLNKFPSMRRAYDCLGTVRSEICEKTGLNRNCEIYVGVHDSNASFLRYKLRQHNRAFTVISTGTWTILMSSGVSLDSLDPQRDMLANVDVEGKPVACARFMGGREFDTICKDLESKPSEPFGAQELQSLVDHASMALPDFSNGSGPFGGSTSAIVNLESMHKSNPSFAPALASLYCAVMMDFQLNHLHATGDVYVEGAFLQNPQLISLLAQLRPQQKVYLSNDETGTVQGCASLTQWQKANSSIDLQLCRPSQIAGLEYYRDNWRMLAEARKSA